MDLGAAKKDVERFLEDKSELRLFNKEALAAAINSAAQSIRPFRGLFPAVWPNQQATSGEVDSLEKRGVNNWVHLLGLQANISMLLFAYRQIFTYNFVWLKPGTLLSR